MSGYTIIDVDTHVTEMPDVWTSRVPAHMRDAVPRVDTDARGNLWWFLGDKRIADPGLTATAGVGDMKHWPKNYDEMHPGAYDAKARLTYMDQLGIWAMVMYPNVGGFGSQQFLKLGDPELMLTCVQVYNDWQTEWASVDSRRLLPIVSTPFWDVAETVREVRRALPEAQVEVLTPEVTDPRPHETYSRALQLACREHRIDVYWCPNSLMPNVLLPTELRGPAIAATVYDLIPWAMRSTYLDRWPGHARDEYLRRLRALPEWADHLLFISNSAREDYLRFDPRMVHQVPEAGLPNSRLRGRLP